MSELTLGPRIVKTGLAVTVALYVCSLLELEPAIFAGVAAILAVQPSIYRTWKQMIDQIITNTVGAAIALLFIYLVGDNPIAVGLVIMIVISFSLKMKMESTIPLTLVTVLAIMSAPGNEDIFFTLNRFLIILIGTFSAILVNIFVWPPKYRKTYLQKVQQAFTDMSLLVRTAISNELTETTYQEQTKKFKKDVQKLEDLFKMFDEERGKLGRLNQLHAREVVVFKQMLKTIQKGEQLLETIEEHYFQSKVDEEVDQLFDDHLEQLVKKHEILLLKYEAKMKEDDHHIEEELQNQRSVFFEQALDHQTDNKDQNQRLMIITASINDYSFHLIRLNHVVEQYLKVSHGTR